MDSWDANLARVCAGGDAISEAVRHASKPLLQFSFQGQLERGCWEERRRWLRFLPVGSKGTGCFVTAAFGMTQQFLRSSFLLQGSVRSRRGRPEGIIQLSGHHIVLGKDTAGTDPIPNIRERSERFTSSEVVSV